MTNKKAYVKNVKNSQKKTIKYAGSIKHIKVCSSLFIIRKMETCWTLKAMTLAAG